MCLHGSDMCLPIKLIFLSLVWMHVHVPYMMYVHVHICTCVMHVHVSCMHVHVHVICIHIHTIMHVCAGFHTGGWETWDSPPTSKSSPPPQAEVPLPPRTAHQIELLDSFVIELSIGVKPSH